MKTLIKILIGVIAVLIIGYLVVMNLPQANIKGATVDEEISANDLYQSYIADEATADTKYLGKVINISGTINDIDTDEQGDPVVLLSNPENEVVAFVTLEPSQKDKIKNYKTGQDISIKAQCSGMLMEVALTKGLIID